MTVLTILTLVLQALGSVAAAPAPEAIDPIVEKAELLANVTHPQMSRDGCAAFRLKDRALWTCGDTMVFDLNTWKLRLPLVVNTASWTDFNKDGTPKIITNVPKGAGSTGDNRVLLMYGRPNATDRKPFYDLTRSDACKLSSAGNCDDGTRTVVWQGGPPVTTNKDGKTTGFAWTANWHFKNGMDAIVKEPSHSLYKLVYDHNTENREALPTTTLVDEAFWKEGEINYGYQGRIIRDGYAYLYGKMRYKWVAVARVPVGKVRNRAKYEYFVNGTWQRETPGINDAAARVTGDLGGVTGGRFFWSPYLNQYAWIGQRNMSLEANFYLSTAPKAEGPWKKPVLIYRGENGDSNFPSYGLMAQPALMSDKKANGMYLTWTQAWKGTTRPEGYITPLVYVTFKK